jgi:hypothetical protein
MEARTDGNPSRGFCVSVYLDFIHRDGHAPDAAWPIVGAMSHAKSGVLRDALVRRRVGRKDLRHGHNHVSLKTFFS